MVVSTGSSMFIGLNLLDNGIGSFISVFLFSLDFFLFFPWEIFPDFGCVISHSSGTVEMCSLIVSFVIIFSISIRFFNS